VTTMRAVLSELAVLQSGKTPSRSRREYFASDGAAWVKTGDLTNRDVTRTSESVSQRALAECAMVVHPPGTVLVAMYGGFAQIGRTGLLRVPAATNQAVMAISCDRDILAPEYLQIVLNARVQYWRRVAGSSRKDANITGADVAAFPLSVPSLHEQMRVVEIERVLAATSRILEQLVRGKLLRKKSVQQQLLKGTCRNHGETRSERSLKSLLTESRELASTGAHAQKLSVKLFGRGVVARADKRSGSPNTQYYRRRAGQFIYSKLDFLNGAFGIVPGELDGYESTLDLPAFDVSDEISTRWLLHVVGWRDFYGQHVRLANGGRKARRVNPAEFLKLTLRVPPLAEQQLIASCLDAIDREIDLLRSLASLYDQRRRALVHKLLSGEIPIPAS